MARPPCTDARSQNPQVNPVWLVAPATPEWWPKEKVEGCDPEGFELDESKWYEEASASRATWRAMCRLGLESSTEERAADQLSVGN